MSSNDDLTKLLISLGVGYVGASILDHLSSQRGFASEGEEDEDDLEGCEEGMFYVDGLFVDTGTPSGGLTEGLDFPMISMNELYRNNNVVFEKGLIHIIPANNNIATGQAIQTLTPCPPKAKVGGWGWAAEVLNESDKKALLRLGKATAAKYAESAVQMASTTGLCGGNFRRIRMQIQKSDGTWSSQTGFIDSGSLFTIFSQQKAQELGFRVKPETGFHTQIQFDPNPEPISTPCSIHDLGQGLGSIPTPVKTIVERVQIILTNDYTILYSLGQGGAVTYNCKNNSVIKGDILQGKWKPDSKPTSDHPSYHFKPTMDLEHLTMA
jgi:hypothetical protein